MTTDKFIWLTSTVKESPSHLSYCSAVQGGAVGTGTFAVPGTNQLSDYLEAVLSDRYFLILTYMLQPGRGTEARRLTSVPRAFFSPFIFTQSHVSIHIHHTISVFQVMGPLKSRKAVYRPGVKPQGLDSKEGTEDLLKFCPLLCHP